MVVELEEKELKLISKALDLYSRIAILQFNYLTDCYSLNEWITELGIEEEFQKKANEMKTLFDYPPNAGPGLFNRRFVKEDALIAAHLHAEIRHFLYNLRGDTSKSGVDAYPSSICDITKIDKPNFKINDNKS